MADSFTPNLNLRKPEVGAAHDTWGAGLNGDMNLIDAVFEGDGDGTEVGLNIGTDKVLRVTAGTARFTADRLVLLDAADPTKIARIGLTNVPTGTTNDYYLPATAGDLVTRTAVQNFTNKTTTDPTAGAATQALVSAKYVKDAIAAAIAALPAPVPPASAEFAVGDIVASAASVKEGWLKLHGTTIGNAGSTAAFANATALNLFNLLWTISTITVSPSKGATAAADWAALKTITLPDARGFALIGTGGAINLTALFATTGAKEHVLTVAQMPSHAHDIKTTANAGGGGFGPTVQSEVGDPDDATENTGGGLAHPNVQPSMAVTYWIKL